MDSERPAGELADASSVAHVLVTRFNLPSAGPESRVRSRDGWLEHRVGLFERYCLPSVAAQTRQDFVWIVYFDEASPEWLREQIDSWRSNPTFRPLFRGAAVRHDELVVDMRALADTSTDELITTNLDNDDALAIDFVERVQLAVVSAPRAAVYLSNGLVRDSSGLYLRHDPSNAFCSVRESWAAPMTCWRDAHNVLPRLMPTVRVGGPPGWLQVVHDINVSNRARGRLVEPSPHHSSFPGLLMDIPSPGLREKVGDSLVKRPFRVMRDLARSTARDATLAVVGRDGLNRIKERLAGGGS